MLSRYDSVLVAFPLTDGPAAKPGSALVITTSARYGDVLLPLQTESQQVLCGQGRAFPCCTSSEWIGYAHADILMVEGSATPAMASISRTL